MPDGPATRADRRFESSPDLDEGRLPVFRAIPYFRVATDAEVDASFAAYEAGDVDELLAVWRREAEPTRAELPPALALAYRHAGKGPRIVNAAVFLASLRAVLRAGERFRETLSPAVREAVHGEFPWLENRHLHVPEGWTPDFEFPGVFREFLEGGDLDDARARWQLAVAVNEVQQSCYSDYAAELFRLPELRRHAARERALAHNYFGHWSPSCTRDLWRETIYVLDALNAATFELTCERIVPRCFRPMKVMASRAEREQWRAFVAGLEQEQWLLA